MKVSTLKIVSKALKGYVFTDGTKSSENFDLSHNSTLNHLTILHSEARRSPLMARYVNVLSTVSPNCLRKLQLIFRIQVPRDELPSDLNFALGETSTWEGLDQLLSSERFARLEDIQVEMNFFRHRGAEKLRSYVNSAMSNRLSRTHATRKLDVSSSIV